MGVAGLNIVVDGHFPLFVGGDLKLEVFFWITT